MLAPEGIPPLAVDSDFPPLDASPGDQQAGFRWERAHRLPEAAECYIAGGAFTEAARVLSHLGWFYEAGAALLLYLPAREVHIGRLDRERKKLCLDAAVCFARAGARLEAVGLLVSFGEHHKAANLLIRAGMRKEAVAAMRGEPVEGSPWPEDHVSPLMSADDVLRRVQSAAQEHNPNYEPVIRGEEATLDPFVSQVVIPSRASLGRADALEETGPSPPPLPPELPEPPLAPRDGDPNEPSHFVGPGTEIRERYVIDREIGVGGMATVYRALDRELNEHVALKMFRVVVPDPVRLRRFQREMKINRRLRHPNIVETYEYGSWGGARFITMELLEGLELWDYLRKYRLDVGERIRLLMQVCDGLGYAHDQGIVHRDIKPSNLFVCDEGRRVKVMDFGIAKAVDSSAISITGVRVGTPRYMSPEQIQGGQQVGPAADLYSLGAVMYEAMTGRAPFEDQELLPLLLNHLSEEPVPPSKLNPDLPPEIDDICLRLLAKNPRERFVDCVATKSALLRAYVMSERRR
jgi:hypothetical protein